MTDISQQTTFIEATEQTAFSMLKSYEAQSLLHAPGAPTDQDDGKIWRGIGYRIGKNYYASYFHQIEEIISMPPLTPLPGAKKWMLGVGNVRGTLIPIVDFQQFLGGDRTVIQMNTRVLIISLEGGKVGVVIDALLGQRTCLLEETDVLEDDDSIYSALFDAEFDDHEHTYTILNLGKLANHSDFLQAAQE